MRRAPEPIPDEPEPVLPSFIRKSKKKSKVEYETYGLVGSPSGELRIENMRRATLEKKLEERKSRKSQRESEISRLSAESRKESKPGSTIHAPPKLPTAREEDKKPKLKQPTAQQPTEITAVPPPTASPEARLSTQAGQRTSLVQRMSVGPTARSSRLGIGSIIAGRRASYGTEDRSKIPKYQPTYRMESKNPFKAWRLKKIMHDMLENEIATRKYEPKLAASRCLQLAGDIRTAIRAMYFDRYKFCVKVDMGQKLDQGVCCMARFMWDVEKDDFAYYACENTYVFIIASVYGLYYD